MRIITAAICLLALSSCGGADSANPVPAEEGKTTVVEDITPVDSMNDANMSVPVGDANASRGPTPVTAAKGDWEHTVTKTAQGGYLMGNPQAKVKLVEYGSRTCPACAAFTNEGMRPLVEQHVSTGRVSYEFRDFIIHGGPDIASSLVGRCGPVETYFPVLEATFAGQEASLGRLASTPAAEQKSLEAMPIQKALAWIAERGGYTAIAAAKGIPAAASARCLADGAQAQRLVDTTNAAKEVTATPTFLINGRQLDAHDWKGVEAALRGAGG